MQVYNPLYHGKSQSCAAAVAVAAFGLIETAPYFRQFLRRNVAAGILNGADNAAFFFMQGKINFAAVFRIFNGIIQKVQQKAH